MADRAPTRRTEYLRTPARGGSSEALTVEGHGSVTQRVSKQDLPEVCRYCGDRLLPPSNEACEFGGGEALDRARRQAGICRAALSDLLELPIWSAWPMTTDGVSPEEAIKQG